MRRHYCTDISLDRSVGERQTLDAQHSSPLPSTTPGISSPVQPAPTALIPVMYVFPHCEMPSLTLYFGFNDRLRPVHASSACRCDISQSSRPSRWTVTMEDMGDLVEMRAMMGLVEETFW